MTIGTKLARRSNRLAIERLEDRENPSGDVTAVLLANGTLALNGDVSDNDVQISLSGAGAVVTGLNGTTITANGSTNTSATLNGDVKSLQVNLRAGNDHLSIVSGPAFSLTGNASIDLGAGNNTLDLSTTGILSIGGNLRVTAANGLDTVNVSGGAGSTIGGHAKIFLGSGGSTVNVNGVTINGAAGLDINTKLGTDTVTLNGLVVTKGGVSIAGGIDQLDVDLTATDNVFRRVRVSGGSGVSVDVDGATLGGLSVSGGANANTNVNLTGSTTINGDLRVSGFNVDVEATGTSLMVTGRTDINARVDATLNATGTTLAVNRNVSVSGRDNVNVTFGTSGAANIDGNLRVNGGINEDTITANGNLNVGGSLGLSLRGGNNTVTLDGNGTDLKVGGNLGISAGAGNDTVVLDQVKVTGNTVISLGAGTDSLTMRDGTTITGRTAIFLGSGADILALANSASATAGVTFNGRAVIDAGADGDTLNLGLSLSAGGTANSIVTFNSPGNLLFAGSGLDLFTSVNAQIIGSLGIFGLP